MAASQSPLKNYRAAAVGKARRVDESVQLFWRQSYTFQTVDVEVYVKM